MFVAVFEIKVSFVQVINKLFFLVFPKVYFKEQEFYSSPVLKKARALPSLGLGISYLFKEDLVQNLSSLTNYFYYFINLILTASLSDSKKLSLE